MSNVICITFVLALTCFSALGVPLVLKESTPSGSAVVAISSSDPNFNKFISFGIPSGTQDKGIEQNSQDGVLGRSFSFVGPGTAAAGTGRGFVSTSAFNPFLLPFFFNPINFEGLGLNHFGANNWLKGVEGAYDPGFGNNGEVKTVSAINDNGHIYGNVKTITFDNRLKPVTNN